MNLQISFDPTVKYHYTPSLDVDLAAISKRKRQTFITQSMRQGLQNRFPLAFMGFEAPKRPLMVGILQAVLAADPKLRKSQVKAAIGNYVGGRTYLRSMIEGAVRIDLDGNPSGQTVTAEEAAYSLDLLKKLDAAYGPSKYAPSGLSRG
jgi:sRNA-binding protein